MRESWDSSLKSKSELWDSCRWVRMWTQKVRKLWHWKPLPGDNQWRFSRLRRLHTCCSELQSVWLSISILLFVVMFCNSSMNPITNSNPVYSHSNYMTLYLMKNVYKQYSVLNFMVIYSEFLDAWVCSDNKSMFLNMNWIQLILKLLACP
jgi:hypothetical protein